MPNYRWFRYRKLTSKISYNIDSAIDSIDIADFIDVIDTPNGLIQLIGGNSIDRAELLHYNIINSIDNGISLTDTIDCIVKIMKKTIYRSIMLIDSLMTTFFLSISGNIPLNDCTDCSAPSGRLLSWDGINHSLRFHESIGDSK